MSSILLSFVGTQDPFGNKNGEGSIITLTRHLLTKQHELKRFILLYTRKLQKNADDTKEWLIGAIPELKTKPENIELIPVSSEFSQDPVNLLLAIQEARKAIEKANFYCQNGDRLELNTSSGTPTMKATWSIIQASGIASCSYLWQVRNPREMLPQQERVFESDITILKKTIDIQTIKQQIACHNYNGALTTFDASNLVDNGIGTLLKCASLRLSSAFKDSFHQIEKQAEFCGKSFHKQSKQLSARQHREIIKEIYFQAEIKAKNKEYSELLVKIFVFQESVLFYLLKQNLLPKQDIDLPMNDKLRGELDLAIANYDGGELQQFLDSYRLNNGRRLVLTSGYNRTVMTAIVEYLYQNNSKICQLLQSLDAYCQQRNDYIHQLKGVSDLEADEITSDIRQILKLLKINIKPNPFEEINKKINSLLDIQ